MKKDPLFKLAKRKRLPTYQSIDAPTVRWIERNRPKFGATGGIGLPSRKILNRFVPRRDWFLEKRLINSIHGLRHIIRVVIYAFLISSKSSYNGKKENLMAAAALHDIRRNNDKGDAEHGLRSANWFKKNIGMVSKKFDIKFTIGDVEEIYWAIRFHELQRSDFTKDKNYSRLKKCVDIVRIADALDRYRLPKIKWWIDEKILGCSVPTRFKRTAFEFVIDSEKNFLNRETSEESVLSLLD